MPANKQDQPEPEPKADRGSVPPSLPKKTAAALGDEHDGGKGRYVREMIDKRLRGEEGE